eukprot:gene5913-7362_t
METPSEPNLSESESSEQVMKNSEISSESSSKDSNGNEKKVRSGLLWSTLFYLKISLWFFGYSVVSGGTGSITWPFQIAVIVNGNRKEYWNGIIPMAGMFINLVTTPIFGYISDNTKTPFGKRRPYLLIGTVIMIVFLCISATFNRDGDSLGGFIVILLGYQFGQGIAGGAFSGIIPDIVHPSQAGVASGWLGVTWSIGTLIGTLAAGNLIISNDAGNPPESINVWNLYGLLIAFLGFAGIVSIFCLYEDKQEEWSCQVSIMGFFKSLYLPVKIYFNFYWVLITRFLNTMGIYMIFGYLYFFCLDVIKKTDLNVSAIIISVIIVFSVPASIAGGYLADYFNTKLLVYISSSIQVIAISLFIVLCFYPSYAGLLVLAALLGVGYGCYQCVDWALAIHSLPNKTIGKDMGIWHLAFIAPTVFAPFISGSILDATKYERGYPTAYAIVFAVATVWFILATVFIFPMTLDANPHRRTKNRSDPELQLKEGADTDVKSNENINTNNTNNNNNNTTSTEIREGF